MPLSSPCFQFWNLALAKSCTNPLALKSFGRRSLLDCFICQDCGFPLRGGAVDGIDRRGPQELGLLSTALAHHEVRAPLAWRKLARFVKRKGKLVRGLRFYFVRRRDAEEGG